MAQQTGLASGRGFRTGYTKRKAARCRFFRAELLAALPVELEAHLDLAGEDVPGRDTPREDRSSGVCFEVKRKSMRPPLRSVEQRGIALSRWRLANPAGVERSDPHRLRGLTKAKWGEQADGLLPL